MRLGPIGWSRTPGWLQQADPRAKAAAVLLILLGISLGAPRSFASVAGLYAAGSTMWMLVVISTRLPAPGLLRRVSRIISNPDDEDEDTYQPVSFASDQRCRHRAPFLRSRMCAFMSRLYLSPRPGDTFASTTPAEAATFKTHPAHVR